MLSIKLKSTMCILTTCNAAAAVALYAIHEIGFHIHFMFAHRPNAVIQTHLNVKSKWLFFSFPCGVSFSTLSSLAWININRKINNIFCFCHYVINKNIDAVCSGSCVALRFRAHIIRSVQHQIHNIFFFRVPSLLNTRLRFISALHCDKIYFNEY